VEDQTQPIVLLVFLAVLVVEVVVVELAQDAFREQEEVQVLLVLVILITYNKILRQIVRFVISGVLDVAQMPIIVPAVNQELEEVWQHLVVAVVMAIMKLDPI
jgi:hypothetical protein